METLNEFGEAQIHLPLAEEAAATPAAPAPTIDLRCGDVLEVLRDMPAGRVSCVVTSPPYWRLRRYFSFDALRLRPELDAETRSMVISRLHELEIIPRT